MGFFKSIRAHFQKVAAACVIAASPLPQALAQESMPPSTSVTQNETCPIPGSQPPTIWLTPRFDVPPKSQQKLLSSLEFPIGRNKADGIFTERTAHSVTEIRILLRGLDFRDQMTHSDYTEAQALAKTTKARMKSMRLDAETATAIRIAEIRTGLSPQVLRNLSVINDEQQWLHLVKTHAQEYGLEYFAEKIIHQGDVYTVPDPFTRDMILALQSHPRLGLALTGEWVADKNPPTLTHQTYAMDQGLVENLRTLGLGGPEAPTRFETLYKPAYGFYNLPPDNLAEAVAMFAEHARIDAREYGISTVAAAAIRLASIRTQADFAYMMELSSAESSFDPNAKAGTSSATGLYQFTEDTWLHMVRQHGEKYGLGALATQISGVPDMYGTLVARAENPFVRFAALELRRDPHLAALMSAEFQMRNKFLIECSVGKPLNRVEQYFGHFLGSSGAIRFLTRLADAPDTNSVKLFPAAASANKSIFYKRDSRRRLVPRNLREVYEVLERKFETGKFDDHGQIPEGTIALSVTPEKKQGPSLP